MKYKTKRRGTDRRQRRHTPPSYVLPFSKIRIKDVPLVGGKTASLGELLSLGLPVPDGFAVTAEAYKLFVSHNKIDDDIRRIIKETDIKKLKELRKAGSSIRTLIEKSSFPPELEKQILDSYRSLGSRFVAVRSSATAEDLPSISEDEYVFVKLNGKPFFGKIKELFDIHEPTDNIEVLSMNSFKTEWKRASNIYRHKANNDVLYRIITTTGRKITISPNHSLIVLDENTLQPRVIEMSELTGKEKIPVAKNIPQLNDLDGIDILDYISKHNVVEQNDKIMIKNNSTNWTIQSGLPRKLTITKDFAYFLGIYAAEGTTYKNNTIIITNSDEKIIEKARGFIGTLGINSENKINKNSFRFYCKTFVRFLNENCSIPDMKIKGKGRTCHTKQVPSFIFSCSKEIIGEFLKGCFDGDGTVSKNVSYSSTSEKLISGIATLLGILGIEFYIHKEKTSFDLYIPFKELEKFRSMIGFMNERKMDRLNQAIGKYDESSRHFEFKNSMKISNFIASSIRNNLESSLTKRAFTGSFCPSCLKTIRKTSKYKGKQRYFCHGCKRTFYDDGIVKKEIEKYVNYNERGRFIKSSVPWNKSANTYPNYGVTKFKEILNGHGLVHLTKILSDDIIWDTIVQIEEVPYDSWVYDFTVPDVENFASGIGNIITHNSASFAGEQESYLNVDEKHLLSRIKDCFASLFTDRAISYREDKHFDHFKVYLSVAVEKQVFSKASGVMFTLDPDSGHRNFVVINSSYGLGDYIVQGRVTPDEFWIFKKTGKLIEKRLGDKKVMEVRSIFGVKQKRISPGMQRTYSISNREAEHLAGYAKKIEEHYGTPMDIEWAKDDKIYIIQARPETVHAKKTTVEEFVLKERGALLAEGAAVGRKIAIGHVNIIRKVKDMGQFKEGEILVTTATDPDWEPIMKIASGIITEEGGRTSHAAIVSRELGIPALVGVHGATKKLHGTVTIDCSGEKGRIWKGSLKYERREHDVKKMPKTRTRIYVNIGEPDEAVDASLLPVDGVGLAREEFIISSSIAEHPLAMIKQNREQIFIDKLSSGVAKIAASFYPRPVVIRFSDFKSNEYKNLAGGESFEPQEENPMIGWRGASRYISSYEPAFRLELRAMKKCLELGLDNIKLMVPFCRTLEEADKTLAIIKEEKVDADIGVMAEIPANVILAREFSKRFKFFSIGSNDLTQLTLGIDRDNTMLAKEFDERNPAVKDLISSLIKEAHKNKRTVGICGDAPSTFPEFTEFLVRNRIDSVSVTPDVAVSTRFLVAKAEKRK